MTVVFQNISINNASVATKSGATVNCTRAIRPRERDLPCAGATSVEPRAALLAASSTQLSTAFQLRTPVLNSTKLGARPLTLTTTTP